jgi:SSS family solute:Na+ symporter
VTRDLGRNLLSWIVGCVLVYSTLFSIGEICFGRYPAGAALGVVAVACGITIWRLMPDAAKWQEG